MTEEILNIGKELERSVNCFGDNQMNELADYLANNIHRTLNQSFTGSFVINFIRIMAKKKQEGSFDGRNESACKMCEVMWNALKENYPWLKDESESSLPLI